jgi:hypothetical protein
MVAISRTVCFAILVFVLSAQSSRADDEPQGSKFVLNAYQIQTDTSSSGSREPTDLSLIVNLILGCEIEVPEGLSLRSSESLSHIHTNCSKSVTKWPSNVEFWIGGTTDWLRDSSSEDARFVLDVLGQISERTGVTFESTLFRPSAELNVLILSEEEKEMEREALFKPGTKPSVANAMRPFLEGKGSGCVGMSKASPEGILTQYLLVVDGERETASRHLCIAESLVRLMGFAGNYSARPLVTSTRTTAGSRMYEVSSDGARTLELLYEAWLVPGMNIEEAIRAAAENLDIVVPSD